MNDGPKPASESHRSCVTVIGAGGNIGSHLVPHLGRMPGVGRVTLIDFDAYEAKNLVSQDILPRDVGRPKARVQARRLRQINPALDVVAHAARVERVPLGALRGDVVIACVDSRIARQSINQIAWRLGIPWIDAGVSAGGELLARVNVYLPGRDAPCLECAWSDDDYRLLEIRHPCQTEAAVAPTNAPSSLGALAASLAAIECRKLLDGDHGNALIGRQVVLDAGHHTHFVTSFRRNSRCRFDHESWNIEPAGASPGALRLRDVETSPGPLTLELEGERFLMRPFCSSGCSFDSMALPEVIGIASRLPARWGRCPACRQPLEHRGWDMTARLPLDVLKKETLNRTLASLNFRPGDIVTLRWPQGERHIELGE